MYDPDRIEADRDLLRRFYLKHGYADVRVIRGHGQYEPGEKGFVDHLRDRRGPALPYRPG